jgi:transmembrane 9 superfamily protein 2/4
MRSTSYSLLLGCALVLFPLSVTSFYLPGAAPHDYVRGDQVNLFVNALTPMLSSSDDDAKLVRVSIKHCENFGNKNWAVCS